jgi:hypothetical protein
MQKFGVRDPSPASSLLTFGYAGLSRVVSSFQPALNLCNGRDLSISWIVASAGGMARALQRTMTGC